MEFEYDYSPEGQKNFYEKIRRLRLKVKLWGNFSEEKRKDLGLKIDKMEKEYRDGFNFEINEANRKTIENLNKTNKNLANTILESRKFDYLTKDKNGFPKYKRN